MSSFSIDFMPVINGGLAIALALFAAFVGLLVFPVGFAIFGWIWSMILGIVGKLRHGF